MKQYKTLLFFFCYFSVISPHIQHSISKKYMKLNEYCDYLGAIILFTGFLGGTSSKEPTCQCSRHKGRGFDPWIGKIPWRGAWQPTPVFLPGESRGQRSQVGYSHKVTKSWTWLKWLSMHAHILPYKNLYNCHSQKLFQVYELKFCFPLCFEPFNEEQWNRFLL